MRQVDELFAAFAKETLELIASSCEGDRRGKPWSRRL